MTLIKFVGLVSVAALVLIIGYLFLGMNRLLKEDNEIAQPTIKALPPVRIAGYLMPAREPKQDYGQLTIRQLKKLAKGTGIKRWERLNKSQLVTALFT
jgi:hypothetical protein